jgi:hypothetical protein
MNYPDVDIRTWAQQIRTIKIRDLKIIVDYLEKELKADNGNTSSIYYIHSKQRVIELKKKLEYLILSA